MNHMLRICRLEYFNVNSEFFYLKALDSYVKLNFTEFFILFNLRR
jgi:hypothetical protein